MSSCPATCEKLCHFVIIRLSYICILCLVIWGHLAIAQDVHRADKSMVHSAEDPVSLPFIMVNNLILIPVQINGSDTLQFIFDTGLENSIICELEPGEILELKHAREVLVREMGSGKLVEGIQSKGNSLWIGNIILQDQDYIIPSTYMLQLSSKMGTNDAIYLPLILILDTGTGNALSLNTSSMPGYSIPVDGRAGNISGKVGRISELLIGPFQLHGVPVSYIYNQIVTNNKEETGHNGSLGAEFLRRFNMILDYPDKNIHIMRTAPLTMLFIMI